MNETHEPGSFRARSLPWLSLRYLSGTDGFCSTLMYEMCSVRSVLSSALCDLTLTSPPRVACSNGGTHQLKGERLWKIPGLMR
jgi:hypothetical protein